MNSEEIIDVFQKKGMRIEIGATYSAKGQIAQLINGVNEITDRACEWKYDDDGYFHTGCNYDYALVDGTLEDNRHNFCPKCGGRIVEI